MKDLSWLVLPLIIAVDLAAIYHLMKRKDLTSLTKLLWALIIISIPILGVSVYYSWTTITRGSDKKRRSPFR